MINEKTYDNFDDNYSDYQKNIENFILLLFLIGIGIPIFFIYLMFKKEPYIQPYGRINYIFANYQNIIQDVYEDENLKRCNRWNYRECISDF